MACINPQPVPHCKGTFTKDSLPKPEKERDTGRARSNARSSSDPHFYRCPFCRQVSWFKPRIEQARRDILKLIFDPTQKVTSAKLTTEWTAKVEMLLVELLSPGLSKLTCKWALCTAGSLARQEACAYSDIECFVLLEKDNEEFKAIVTTAAKRCKGILLEAGEAGRGFSFDEGMSPEDELWVATPATMIVNVRSQIQMAKNSPIGFDPGNIDVLQDHHLVQGSDLLYKEWSRLAAEYMASRSKSPNVSNSRNQALLEWRQWMEIQPKRKSAGARRPVLADVGIQIKDNYYRWLQKIPKYLCQYYGLSMGDTRQQVSALARAGHISQPVELLFLDCLDKVTRMRMEGHLLAGGHAGDSFFLARRARPNAPQTVTHVEVAGQLLRKRVLLPHELMMIRDVIPKINAVVTMAEDFLQWAKKNDPWVTIVSSGTEGQALKAQHSGKEGNVRFFDSNPFRTMIPQNYKRVYPGSDEALLPTNIEFQIVINENYER